MFETDKTYAEIGLEMGCSKQYVAQVRKEFNINRPIHVPTPVQDVKKSSQVKSSKVKSTKSVPGVQIDLDKFLVEGLAMAPITLKAKMVYYLTTGSLRSMSLKEFANQICEFWETYRA